MINKNELINLLDQVMESNGSLKNLQDVYVREFSNRLTYIDNLLANEQISEALAERCKAKLSNQQEEFKPILDQKKRKLSFSIKVRDLHKSLKNRFSFMRWQLNTFFENFIYLCIFTNMIILVLANPNDDPSGNKHKRLNVLEELISQIFFIEALLRILALGFWTTSLPGRKPYFESGTNKIDFFTSIAIEVIILAVQKMQLFKTDDDFESTSRSLKVIRAMRALKPLRLISKSEGLILAVMSLLTALPSILNGMMVCGLIIFIYAIIGISLFKGKFQHCVFTELKDE